MHDDFSELDAEFFRRVNAARPVNQVYVAGRWHPNRVTLKGIEREVLSIARAAITPPNKTVKKFLIIGRSRSGTSLLTRLLDSHSQIHCTREVLSKSVVSPVAFLDRLARNCRLPVYGAKLLSFQMVMVQRIGDPVRFLERLRARGFYFVHITRDTFSQTLSHEARFGGNPVAKSDSGKIMIDPEAFVKQLQWSETLLDYEKRALRHFPHFKISYEDSLLVGERHDAVIAELCAELGIPPEPVSAPFNKKLLPADPRQTIVNFEEVVAEMVAHGLEHLIPAID